jgi:ribosomal-protein-alanine N-acetyltransferase
MLLTLTAFMDAPFQPLETARLRLRCISPDDAHATSAMMTPEVSRWVAYWPFPFTYEMAVERIESSLKLAHAGDMLPFAVIEKTSDEMIGWVMFNRDTENRRRGYFGYWLGKKHHGKGYMKELAGLTATSKRQRYNSRHAMYQHRLGHSAAIDFDHRTTR